MSPRRKCLVLSAHDGLIDRRIIAQVNHLAAHGREVTLVSVPARGGESLVQAVRLVMADGAKRRGGLRGMARRLPAPVKTGLKSLAWRVAKKPLEPFDAYFETHTPDEKFDAIHCHDLQTLPAGLRLREQVAPSAKVIYDSHELFPAQFREGRLRRYWGKVEAAHIRQADAVVTVNDSIARLLCEKYNIPLPTVLYNSCHLPLEPVSTGQFRRHFGLAAQGKSPRDEDAFSIMFQGGFLREKNVETLARAFAELGARYQLFFLGGGDLEQKLLRMAKGNKAQNVYVGKWVKAEELLGYLQHVHAGVIPYLDDGLPNNHYCTPNKLFEYLEAGLPICANDLPELRRIVGEGGIGRIYPLNTQTQVAEAIIDFAARCRSGEFTAESFAAAQETYAWSRQATKLLNLYEQLGV